MKNGAGTWRPFYNVYSSGVYIRILRVLAEAYPSALRGAEVYRRLKPLGLAPKRVQHVYKYLETLEKAGFVRSSEKGTGLKTRSSGRR